MTHAAHESPTAAPPREDVAAEVAEEEAEEVAEEDEGSPPPQITPCLAADPGRRHHDLAPPRGHTPLTERPHPATITPDASSRRRGSLDEAVTWQQSPAELPPPPVT
jgi:hypothetical protein